MDCKNSNQGCKDEAVVGHEYCEDCLEVRGASY